MWSVLSFCYTLLVILRKNHVNTLYCWTRQISMDMTAEERKRRLAPEDELWCWLCASWDTNFLRRTLPCALVWTRALCQDYTAAGRKFWKHASMSFPFGRTRLQFRNVCQLLSRTSILTHVSSSILRRDWDWLLSQPDTQSLTWFDYRHRTFKSCFIYPFTNALQPVGLWSVHIFDNFDSAFSRSTSKKKITQSSRALVLDFRFSFFAFLRCTIFLFLFSNLQFWCSTTVSSFVWCPWTPATMHRPDEFVSEL